MIKHASSHGFAVLMCTIISAIIVDLLAQFIPEITRKVDELSAIILNQIALPLSLEYMTIVLVASVLAMIWGVFFKMSHSK